MLRSSELRKQRKLLPTSRIFIKELISLDCSVTLKAIKDSILREKNQGESDATVFHAIENFNYTLKSGFDTRSAQFRQSYRRKDPLLERLPPIE